MSVKTPSERFLMTVPKPIHDWLSEEADKLGVTVQDRIRVMLEESQKRKNENVSLYGQISEKKKKQWKLEELEDACYSIGSVAYDTTATERRRLEVLEVSDDGGVMWFEGDTGTIMLPVISKSFYPLDPNNELLALRVYDAAKQVAELENKLLSICEDGDDVYQALPFKCFIWHRADIWEGAFRVCLNSARTPTISDVSRITS